jgi:hypothetical protein
VLRAVMRRSMTSRRRSPISLTHRTTVSNIEV